MGFTGIVEEMGVVISMEEVASMNKWDGSVGKGYHLTVESKVVLQDATMGCSIAVNGTCLTVTAFDQATGIFTVGVTPETLRLTNLKALKKGDKVNLERAMSAADRNSGHNVQGHVEGTGQVKVRTACASLSCGRAIAQRCTMEHLSRLHFQSHAPASL